MPQTAEPVPSPSAETWPEGTWDPGHPHLRSLNSAISNRSLPCSSGTLAVKEEDLILYYGAGDPQGLARRIDFSAASEEAVAHLAHACQPAKFGLNQVDVLDETYRKAGKLDFTNFSPTFDLERTGLMEEIRYLLLDGHPPNTSVRAELYKLNVYGPGSFFKAHRDTPRADNMFASLVVVYPTRHEGGALIFRHKSEEYIFDSAKAIADADSACVAYAAFYSDVEHEVDVVKSGYRVTLTYNLYFKETTVSKLPSTPGLHEVALKQAFMSILSDETYLPAGGLIGFGLRHEYPMDTTTYSLKAVTSLDHLFTTLKGSDAVLMKVCKDLGLKVSLRMVYHDDNVGVLVLCPGLAHLRRKSYDEDVWMFLRRYGGRLLGVVRDVEYYTDRDEVDEVDKKKSKGEDKGESKDKGGNERKDKGEDVGETEGAGKVEGAGEAAEDMSKVQEAGEGVEDRGKVQQTGEAVENAGEVQQTGEGVELASEAQPAGEAVEVASVVQHAGEEIESAGEVQQTYDVVKDANEVQETGEAVENAGETKNEDDSDGNNSGSDNDEWSDYDHGEEFEESEYDSEDDRWKPKDVGPDVTVAWATEMSPSNRPKTESSYLAYGNQAVLCHTYSDIVLIVELDFAENRKALGRRLVA